MPSVCPPTPPSSWGGVVTGFDCADPALWLLRRREQRLCCLPRVSTLHRPQPAAAARTANTYFGRTDINFLE
ncbi:hypothetical protein Pmani_039512 [Petrolisthes manimaculis]|uniref:Uncharacterized protein n=1 Tax=Petrolisthes manimaculis TaxID=1843537 RepID=A0AAE1TLA0_9EUCA|nr:hypothetical protein Pmani_039512 [Petrolisthes manimaculis]